MMSHEQEIISKMFDRIAPNYDRVNRLLSFKFDLRWRKKLSRLLPHEPDLLVLDVATGTADLITLMCQQRLNIKKAIGIDLSENMLRWGRKKISEHNLTDRITLQKANAADLPFADESFDVVSIAFGIRNVFESSKALLEFARVLKPTGLLMILEFSLPQNMFLRMIYLFYFRHILPGLGGLISREKSAYRYLNQSVEAFPKPHDFIQVLLHAGFKKVDTFSLTFGIATIYCARKF